MTPHPTRKRIFYHLRHPGDTDQYATGWYFSTEAEQLMGPYEASGDAIRALHQYQESLDDPSPSR